MICLRCGKEIKQDKCLFCGFDLKSEKFCSLDSSLDILDVLAVPSLDYIPVVGTEKDFGDDLNQENRNLNLLLGKTADMQDVKPKSESSEVNSAANPPKFLSNSDRKSSKAQNSSKKDERKAWNTWYYSSIAFGTVYALGLVVIRLLELSLYIAPVYAFLIAYAVFRCVRHNSSLGYMHLFEMDCWIGWASLLIFLLCVGSILGGCIFAIVCSTVFQGFSAGIDTLLSFSHQTFEEPINTALLMARAQWAIVDIIHVFRIDRKKIRW